MSGARPLALDLFCGAGGASMGLHRAGFEVFGIDVAKQANYPFWFRRANALDVELSGFTLIWASPPCQAFSSATFPSDRHKSEDLIPKTRERLARAAIDDGALTVIENVPRAPIRPDVILQGDMFALRLVRRRHFETNFACLAPGALTGGRGLVQRGLAETVAGGGTAAELCRWKVAMGIDWMTRRELVNAVPPDYAEFVGRWAMRAIAAGPGSTWPSERPGAHSSGCSLGQVEPGPAA